VQFSRKIGRIGLAVSLLGALSLASLRGGNATSLASVGGLSGLAGISGKLLAVFALPGDAPARELAGAPTAAVSLLDLYARLHGWPPRVDPVDQREDLEMWGRFARLRSKARS